MAVTITLQQLAHEVRVTTNSADSGITPYYVTILQRDLNAATEMVERRAPLAPTESQNKAVVRIVGYWLQSPEAPPQRYGLNVWQHSGAAQILGPFIERRAQAI